MATEKKPSRRICAKLVGLDRIKIVEGDKERLLATLTLEEAKALHKKLGRALRFANEVGEVSKFLRADGIIP